jgi:cbb3-type cytochrome oxidase subunit 3
MISRDDLVIIYLSIILAAVQWQLYRAVKDSAYNAGRMSVFEEQAAAPSDGTRYAKGDK